MREVVLDTETTGLDPEQGHRVVEIACLELVNRVPSGRTFQTYVNPERDMPEEAFRIHGLSQDFLSGHPVFAAVAEDFLGFIADAPLVIHNAEFDLKFLNAELRRMERPALSSGGVINTLALARRRFPGAQANLDALCRRFNIDNSARSLHGALLDCELLAEVYLELSGGRQPGFDLAQAEAQRAMAGPQQRVARPARPHAPSDEERTAHEAMLAKLSDPIWRQ